MLKRVTTTALGAGVIAGIFLTVLQHFTLMPLIRHAEIYERAAEAVTQSAAPAGEAAAHEHEAGTEAPSAEATIILTIGYALGQALLLTGAFAISGRSLSGREGVFWGLAGFATFALAPSMGLAPEVPGAVAADVSARQVWWVMCVLGTAAGLTALVFGKRRWLIPVGLFLLAAPHIIGAPQPVGESVGLAPPELAAEFAARALGVAFVFWSMMGWVAGTLYTRHGRGLPRTMMGIEHD
jgi:cobalt transporter subunit CbtA